MHMGKVSCYFNNENKNNRQTSKKNYSQIKPTNCKANEKKKQNQKLQKPIKMEKNAKCNQTANKVIFPSKQTNK